MGISIRRFFIANDGALYRISNAKLDRMMRHPESELVPIFAGQRIRTAELVIELSDSKPFRVCRETFSIFQFDGQGCRKQGSMIEHHTSKEGVEDNRNTPDGDDD